MDSGRLSIPVPERGYLEPKDCHQDTRAYKYYTEGSDRYRVLEFMYNPEKSSDERWAFQQLMRVVLLYRSKEEKNAFEGYISFYPEKVNEFVDASDKYDYIVTENQTKMKGYKRSLRIGPVLNALLKKWRELGI